METFIFYKILNISNIQISRNAMKRTINSSFVTTAECASTGNWSAMAAATVLTTPMNSSRCARLCPTIQLTNLARLTSSNAMRKFASIQLLFATGGKIVSMARTRALKLVNKSDQL